MVDGPAAEKNQSMDEPIDLVLLEQGVQSRIARLHAVIDRLTAGLTYEADVNGTKQHALDRIRALVSTLVVSARGKIFDLQPEMVDRMSMKDLIVSVPDQLKKGSIIKSLEKAAASPLVGDPVVVMRSIGLSGDEQMSVDGQMRTGFSNDPFGDWYYFGLLQDPLS